MYEQVEKTKEGKSRDVASSILKKKGGEKKGFSFVGNRPESIVQRKLQGLAKSNTTYKQQVIQRIIKFEYDESGRELIKEREVPFNKIFSELVTEYGLPRTNRMMLKLKEFDDKNAIFSDIPELVSVLKLNGVPIDSLANQAGEVFSARKQDRTSNFANAIIIIDVPNAPAFKTKISGSGRVGNSVYAFPSTQKKKLSFDIEQSQNDSEVGLFQEIHNTLFNNKELSEKLSQKKPKVYIRVMSNMGPCDGCKERLSLLRENFFKILAYNDLVVDVHYASKPGKANNRVSSTYGWEGDKLWKSGMKGEGLYAHQNA